MQNRYALERSSGMKVYAVTLVIVALAGCSADSPSPIGEEGNIVTSLREIQGPWDIESFAGYTPTRLHGGVRRAFVDISPEGLSYAIECNYSGTAARIDEDGVLHDENDGPGLQTLMGCGPEGEAREGAFFAFFSSKPKVSWADNGRVQMSSGSTRLILQRPEARRLANIPPLQEITGRWVPQMAIRTSGSGHSGWGFQKPGVVIITATQLSYTGCGGAAFDFRYTADARMETLQERAPSTCGSDTPGTIFLGVMRNDPLVERMSDGIALTAGSEVITLQSEEYLRRLQENPPTPPPVNYAPPAPPLR